jgi:glycosyltransferase involved in cell wall biosynthesis
MLWEGRSQCDGQIIDKRCAQCFMQSRGIPTKLAKTLAQMPSNVSAELARIPGIGGVLSARGQAERTAAGLKSIADAVDCIITVCQWLKDALLLNGIPEQKIRFVKSGVDPELAASADPAARKSSRLLRIGFIGRWNQAKGLHILIAALQRLPKDTEFHLTALAAGSNDKAAISYRARIEEMIAGKPQYQLLSDQPRAAIKRFFENIDVLAVPSQWLENAPLVVLEANAWKVPVVGSDLGGIREMVRHEVDGLLLPHANIEAWTNALHQLAQEPMLLQRLQSNIPSVRTMRDTARDMMGLYRLSDESCRRSTR